jgi:hypothetical protein
MNRRLPPLWITMSLEDKLVILEQWGLTFEVGNVRYLSVHGNPQSEGGQMRDMSLCDFTARIKPTDFEHLVNRILKSAEDEQ